MVALAPIVAPSGIDHVCEHHGWTKKYIVLTNHTGVYGNVILHFYIIAQHNQRGHYYILTHVTVLTNFASGHNMRKVPDFSAGTNLAILINDCGFMRKIRFGFSH